MPSRNDSADDSLLERLYAAPLNPDIVTAADRYHAARMAAAAHKKYRPRTYFDGDRWEEFEDARAAATISGCTVLYWHGRRYDVETGSHIEPRPDREIRM